MTMRVTLITPGTGQWSSVISTDRDDTNGATDDNTHHHSQVNTSWLNMVPLGQRKETGTRA